MSSPPLSRLHQRKRYSREEVDGVRKEKERLTTDHQPREIIDGRLTCLFPGTPTASLGLSFTSHGISFKHEIVSDCH